MAVEICQNCEHPIGRLEQAYVFKGHIVCEACNMALQKKRSTDKHSTNSEPKSPNKEKEDEVQTIEKTGKEFKFFMLIGMIIVAVTLFLYYNGTIDGNAAKAYGFVGGLIFIGGKVLGWWFHG